MSFRSEDLVSVALKAGEANVVTNLFCTRGPNIGSAAFFAVVGSICTKGQLHEICKKDSEPYCQRRQ